MMAVVNKTKHNVCYVWDETLITHCDRLPAVLERSSLVHNLIESYGLVKHMKMVRSSPATYEELREFHSELYLEHLKRFTDVDEEYETSGRDEEYGIGYDCPPVSNMFELVSTIAGGSITAAKCLVLGLTEVSINWCGGWHHAHRFGAEGFCYVNDIVLAIEVLRRKFSKVLYVDLDVHHGNGVQDAYNLSKSVFTLSIHKFEPGFYPGTGGVDDIGTLNGQGYSCNVPLQGSYCDDTLTYVFDRVFPEVYGVFAPDAIVVQCGADALAYDPHGGANLTIDGYSNCVRKVLDKRKPTLLLGGGGYNHPNTARLWTSLTALVAAVSLDENIPEHSLWPSYGPDYLLRIEPTLARDVNKKSYLDNCILCIKNNLQKLERPIKMEVTSGSENKRRKMETTQNKENTKMETTQNKENTKMETTQNKENTKMETTQNKENTKMETTQNKENTKMETTQNKENTKMETTQNKENTKMETTQNKENTKMETTQNKENTKMETTQNKENTKMETTQNKENTKMETTQNKENTKMETTQNKENTKMETTQNKENTKMETTQNKENTKMETTQNKENTKMETTQNKENTKMETTQNKENTKMPDKIEELNQLNHAIDVYSFSE